MNEEEHPLFKYERGLLYDFVNSISGLNEMNILNSGCLVKGKIFTYVGDVQYNLFQTRRKKYQKEIKEQNPDFFDKAKEIVSNLGIKWTGTDNFDTYYGVLLYYAWHREPSETGVNFTPIYHLIDQLKNTFPEEKSRLNAIYRRMVYLEILENEFIYLKKKYDFDTIPILIEWTTNKFETFTTLLVELSMIIIEFYYDKHPNLEPKEHVEFKNLINYIKDIDQLFSSINFTVEGFLAVTLRNNMVHSSGYELVREGEDTFVLVKEELIEKNLKFGILEDYVKDIAFRYSGKKVPNTVQKAIDLRFPYMIHHLKISNAGTIDYPKTKISFKLELEEYLKLMMGFLFRLSRELFNALIKTQGKMEI
ncbi:MAG: hypothetical protein KAT65_24860 [Methanophagales archaeon]|nr:hypothetical protein [Methanophagales archaeon]